MDSTRGTVQKWMRDIGASAKAPFEMPSEIEVSGESPRGRVKVNVQRRFHPGSQAGGEHRPVSVALTFGATTFRHEAGMTHWDRGPITEACTGWNSWTTDGRVLSQQEIRGFLDDVYIVLSSAPDETPEIRCAPFR